MRNGLDGRVAGQEAQPPTIGSSETDNVEAGRPSAAEAQRLRRLARFGAFALSARTVIAQLAALGGQIILARRLAAEDFGIFAVVQFAMTFLTFFGDAGLGAALVQQKAEPTRVELSSVFYVQAVLGAVVLALAFAAAPVLRWVWPNFPPYIHWVFAALAFNFLLTSLRCVPGLLFERRLQFVKIAVLDTCGSVTFYAVAAGLALADFHVAALVGGVLAQGTLTLLLAYAMCSWRPSLEWSGTALRPLLRFGVPFQLHFVVGLFLSALTPVFGGRLLGAHTVGLLNWSQTTAHFPLTLGQIISRISFPLYSRLQGDRAELVKAVERSIRICALGTMLFVGVVLATAPQLIRIVYSDRWLEALPFLYIHTAAITVGFFTPVAATVLEALGRPGLVLRLSTIVVGLIWITVPPATLLWGPMGFVGAYTAMMVLGNVAMVFTIRSLVPDIRVVRPLLPLALACVLTAGLGRWWFLPRISGPGTLIAAILTLSAVFAGLALAADRKLWREEVAPRIGRLRLKLTGQT